MAGMFPMGWSLRFEADRIEQTQRAKRLSAAKFASHPDPKRAAKATVSLRTAYPWMSPNVAARLGAFGADPADPAVAEIAGTAAARRSRRGWVDGGGRRNANEVRNVRAPVDPDVAAAVNSGMTVAEYRRWRDSLGDPGSITAADPATNPVGPADIGVRTGETGADYAAEYMGPMSPQQRRAISRTDPSQLAEQFPDMAERFTANATTFAMARNIAEGSDDANLAFSLRSPAADPAAAREMAQHLPSLDTTVAHLRRGGLSFRGIPLPGGDVGVDELREVYTGPNMGEIAGTLARKRTQLEEQYEGLAGSEYPTLPDGVTVAMRAVYDGIVEVLDGVIEPERESFGPDLSVAGLDLNLGDAPDTLWGGAKAGVRTATMAMDTLWQAGSGRFRQIVSDPTDAGNWAALNPTFSLPAATTALATGGGVDPLDMGEQYGQTDFGIVLERIANGRPVDTGSGFFVAPDSGVAETRRERERVYGDVGGHIITMGRWTADRIGLEPDTQPFDIVSGAIDLAWVLAEPGGAVVDVASRAPATRRLLAHAGGFAETRSIHPERFDEWIRGGDGQRIIQHYADLDTPLDISRSWERMSQQGGANRMPEWAHYLMADGDVGDVEYVEEMLRNLTGMAYHSPGVAVRGERATAGLGAAVAPGVAWRRRLNRSRLAQDAPEAGARALDIYDADGFVGELRASLRNARVDEDTISGLVYRAYTDGFQAPNRVRIQQIERQLAELPESGPMLWRGSTADAAVVRAELSDTLAELRPGLFINRVTPQRAALYEVWEEAQAAKRARLIEAGVEGEQAKKLTLLAGVGRRLDHHFIEDHQSKGAYWLRLVSEDGAEGAANRRVWGMLDGEHITDMSSPSAAHMAAEHLTRYLPLEEDPRQIARLTRSVPTQWLNKLVASPGTGQLRTYAALADSFMSKIWKPSRLIRPAYPLRVVGEEQLRIGAAGFDGLFTHPFTSFALIMGTRRDGRLHRGIDALGGGPAGRNVTDVMGTPWENVAEFRGALNRGQWNWLIPTGGGSGGRFEPHAYLNVGGQLAAGYPQAWTDLLARAHSDDLVRRIAQIELGLDSEYGSIDELIEAGGRAARTPDDLRRGPAQNQIAATRADLMDSHPVLGRRGERSYARRYAGGSPDEAVANWDDYIESLQVRLFEITGRDPELLHTVARGQFTDGMRLDSPNATRLNRRAARRLESDYARVAPPAISGDAIYEQQSLGRAAVVHDGAYDRALEQAFALFGATPTDRLSRSPAFRDFYWRRMQELMPFMTDAAQRRALAAAEASNLKKVDPFHIRISAYIDDSVVTPTSATLNRAAQGGKGDLTLEMADDLAKHAALDNTRWLLYDVHKRGTLSDSLRLIAPFFEAWKEVGTRWMQLLAQRPGTVTQRATQIVGATGTPQPWEEVVEDPTQHGALFTNSNGQTVFTYPGSEWFTAAMSGAPTQLTGSLNGLTIFSSVLPGAGPVVQMPMAMSSVLRESPRFDGVREALFPFGMGENLLENWPGAVADLVMSPAWQRIIQGLVVTGTGRTAEDDLAFMNSLADVMRFNVSTGEYTTDSDPAITRLIEDSTVDAGILTAIRGGAGLVLPSAPMPEMQVEGADGSLLMLRALRDRFRQMQEEDYTTATQRFLDDYGERLGLVLQSTSVPATTMVPVTEEADRWVRENPRAKEEYPLTFGLFAPGNVDGDFDIDAWGRNIRDRAVRVLGRELRVEDYVYLANDRVASSIYRDTEAGLLGRPDAVTESGNLTDEARAHLRDVRSQLEDRYPGFGRDGLVKGPSTEDLQSAIGRPGQTNTEIRRMVDDDLFPFPLRSAVRTYLEVHDEAISAWAPAAGAADYYTSEGTADIREYLRYTVAPGIRSEMPRRYRPQWDVIFDRLFDRVMLDPGEAPVADDRRLAA